jgi:hypothetical protein
MSGQFFLKAAEEQPFDPSEDISVSKPRPAPITLQETILTAAKLVGRSPVTALSINEARIMGFIPSTATTRKERIQISIVRWLAPFLHWIRRRRGTPTPMDMQCARITQAMHDCAERNKEWAKYPPPIPDGDEFDFKERLLTAFDPPPDESFTVPSPASVAYHKLMGD